MRMRSKVLALFFIIAIPLVLSSCSTMGPDAKLPPNKVLYAKITEVGRAIGMPLVYEDKKEGLFIFRFGTGRCDGRFVWYVKRAGNGLPVDDPATLRGKRGMCGLNTERVPQMQEEFKRRFLALAGPIRLRAPGKTHSVKKMMDAISASRKKK